MIFYITFYNNIFYLNKIYTLFYKKTLRIAKKQEVELKIQNKDWKISQANSYWRDSFPPGIKNK